MTSGRVTTAVVLGLLAAGCSGSGLPPRSVSDPSGASSEPVISEPSPDPNAQQCVDRGLTAFCDDVFTGPNKVTVAVHPTSARPGETVRVQGMSDCGDGQLEVAYKTGTGKAVPIHLSWRYVQGSSAAFSGSFVVPMTPPGVLSVAADAYCMEANYENTATAKLTVTPRK